MSTLNIQKPSGETGLSLEEKALRGSLGSEETSSKRKLVNYSRISSESLSIIATAYVTCIKRGGLYFWFPLTDEISICLRPLSDDEIDECTELSAYGGIKLQFFYSIIGYNSVFINDEPFLWKLVNFLCNIGLDAILYSVINDLQAVYTYMFHFSFAIVDLLPSKSLWEWYKINGSNRKLRGLNDLEMDWVYLNSLRDYYSYFYFVQVMSGLWGGKKLSAIETCYTQGFSTIGAGYESGSDSVNKLAREIEMELSGEKDEHAKAVEHMESRIIEKAKKRQKSYEEFRRTHNYRKGVYAEVSWG